jgi:hypothetical protein
MIDRRAGDLGTLLIGLLLIGKQMNYMRHKNLGFDKDNNLCYIHIHNMVLNKEGFLEKIQ